MQQSSMLGSFNLTDEIEKFDPSDRTSGRRAETLIKTDHLRVVLVTMKADAELQEHDAPGPITIHALTGAFVVNVDDRNVDLPAGHIISIKPQARHAVRATRDGAFLLTIGWSPDSAGNVPPLN
ncbi:hypothetical protein BH20CHL1_BH20CHL1_06300 [soil metagenome]|nr:cupin domain-containing protein [Chloroflexia bacterium]